MDAVAHYRRGNEHKDAGQFEAALASYDRAIELKPDYAHALCNRGVVLAALQRTDAALESYDRALALDPGDAIAHYNRAVLLQQRKQWEAARAAYQRTLQLNAGFFHAHFNLGAVHMQLRQWDSALTSYDAAIAIDPGAAAAHFNRGVILQMRGQARAALACYERAITLDPGLYQAFFKRGTVLQELKDPAGALASYDRALGIHRASAEAWLNRGVVLQELGRIPEALGSYDEAIALNSGYAEGWFNRGTLQNDLDQWEDALASFDRAIAIRAGYAEAHFQRGVTLAHLRRVEAAIASYDRAIALQPDLAEAQYNRALALLLAGDYAQGWRCYEWRWKNAAKLFMGAPRTFRQPLWLGGEELRGRRILIYAEQGLGDTLQFCRYVKLLADRGAEVIFEVQAPLAGLLARQDGFGRVLAAGSALPDFDLQCPLMSLPLALDTTLASIPAPPRYLRTDAAKLAQWQARLGPRKAPRIGLVWSGNAQQGNDRNRSIPLAAFLAQLPRSLDYVCLQKEIRPADAALLAANPWIRTCTADIDDFSDTAALVESTDLVLSVCTSVVHLAGALGHPTWAMLTFDADWRWLLGRTDSPWYPATTLYRQDIHGDWRGLLRRIAADLSRRFSAA
jgi:tetratricopeptide (TPR) repeat protein